MRDIKNRLSKMRYFYSKIIISLVNVTYFIIQLLKYEKEKENVIKW